MKEVHMRELRRKEKKIRDRNEMLDVIRNAKYITLAMCEDNMPYLVTLSHGYDAERNAIYFHCAKEGKKIDILRKNNVVWGQALLDKGYVSGKCNHLFAATDFRGRVYFVADNEEKRHALVTMIRQLEPNPDETIKKLMTDKALNDVNIGRIDLDYMSGKKSEGT